MKLKSWKICPLMLLSKVSIEKRLNHFFSAWKCLIKYQPNNLIQKELLSLNKKFFRLFRYNPQVYFNSFFIFNLEPKTLTVESGAFTISSTIGLQVGLK